MINDYMAVIGSSAAKYSAKLSEYFASVTMLPPSPNLTAAVSSHPDMLIAVVGGKLICHRDYYDKNADIIDRISIFGGLKVTLSQFRMESEYPYDCIFNGLFAADTLFCRTASTAPELINAAKLAGIRSVNVKQGYAGCSSLFARGCVISADPSILSAAKREGFSTAELQPGGILLPGYSCGFIGGAGGVCENNAYFFGDISNHPDSKLLYRILKELGLSAVCLGNGPLTDFGGIKFIPRG